MVSSRTINGIGQMRVCVGQVEDVVVRVMVGHLGVVVEIEVWKRRVKL